MMITVVLAIRNRPYNMVSRCIESLKRQTNQCQIIVVDYGSVDLSWYDELFPNFVATARGASDFNKSRALNIGIKLATTKYVVTSDIDNIFPPRFIKEVEKAIVKPKTLVLCDRIDTMANGKTKPHPRTAYGACFGIDRDWLHKVHGYDEGFINWGKEDDDIYRRAVASGYTPLWLDTVPMTHQYHEPASKESLQQNTKRLIHSKGIVRNPREWGALV